METYDSGLNDDLCNSGRFDGIRNEREVNGVNNHPRSGWLEFSAIDGFDFRPPGGRNGFLSKSREHSRAPGSIFPAALAAGNKRQKHFCASMLDLHRVHSTRFGQNQDEIEQLQQLSRR
jgi:hypothetical protein